MSSLPDELWRRILELGIQNCGLSYKDLCCFSISCRRFHRLSGEDPLWNLLLSSDFPSSSSSSSSSVTSSSKSLYKFRFERDNNRKKRAHKRVLLRKESQIFEHLRKLRDIEIQKAQEIDKMRETVAELSNLRNISCRQASVALNVWQPKVIRGRQKQMVEQNAVPAESRMHALEMELRLCEQQIMGLERSYIDEKLRLDTAKEEFVSLKYHPLREHNPLTERKNEHKRKKLERCNSFIAWMMSNNEMLGR